LLFTIILSGQEWEKEKQSKASYIVVAVITIFQRSQCLEKVRSIQCRMDQIRISTYNFICQHTSAFVSIHLQGTAHILVRPSVCTRAPHLFVRASSLSLFSRSRNAPDVAKILKCWDSEGMGYARPSIWKNLLAEQMKQQSVIMALSLVLWYVMMTMAAQEYNIILLAAIMYLMMMTA
jgi:hypothetical protein